ncbi:MATE family efflux transporter [Fontivita pretiosa]|uniref:MATE family efflux transporter n=1 Tax=Fontivita pretiosa TaxID=2989684 RepID=UPI003D181F40
MANRDGSNQDSNEPGEAVSPGTLTQRMSRRPIVELLLLAAPTVAQMASYTLMQFADRWMLARVGDLEAAAAGTSGITYFCVIGFGFGVLLLVNTLVSQSFGRRDLGSTGRYLWQGMWFGVAFGVATLLLWPLAEPMFRVMGHEPRMVRLEAQYMRVVSLAGWAKLAAVAMSQFLLGLHRPGIVFAGTLVGILANVFFNWLLIYGNWGFAALGVAGAAWGTNAAVTCELLIMGLYVWRAEFARVHATLDWRVRWPMLRTLLRVGLPAGFQLVCDIAAWTIFMNVIVASFGTAALSANSFAFSYMHLCFMPAIGVGNAVTALVGKYIGMGRPDLSARRAHLGFVVCAIYMVLTGIVLWAFRYQLLGIFSQDPQVLRIGSTIMFFVAIYQIFDAMFVVYVGALRGAGDTLVPAAVQAVLVWTIVVFGGAVLAWRAPQYGVAGPWTLATVFGALLGLFLLWRFVRGQWRSIRLHHDQAQPAISNVSDQSAKLSVLTEASS